jgi:hypothetical protein
MSFTSSFTMYQGIYRFELGILKISGPRRFVIVKRPAKP